MHNDRIGFHNRSLEVADTMLESIITGCIASFLIYAFKSSGLFGYALDVMERMLCRQAFPLFECMGGIVVPVAGDPQIEMDSVPDHLYDRVLGMAKIQVAQGLPLRFDLKIVDRTHVYWIHAGMDGGAHVLSFFQRPRLFP